MALSILHVPNEIILIILRQISTKSDIGVGYTASVTSETPPTARPQTLSALASTCRRLCSLAQPLLYRHVIFRDENRLQQLIGFLEIHPHLLRTTTSLTVNKIMMFDLPQLRDVNRLCLGQIHVSVRTLPELRKLVLIDKIKILEIEDSTYGSAYALFDFLNGFPALEVLIVQDLIMDEPHDTSTSLNEELLAQCYAPLRVLHVLPSSQKLTSHYCDSHLATQAIVQYFVRSGRASQLQEIALNIQFQHVWDKLLTLSRSLDTPSMTTVIVEMHGMYDLTPLMILVKHLVLPSVQEFHLNNIRVSRRGATQETAMEAIRDQEAQACALIDRWATHNAALTDAASTAFTPFSGGELHLSLRIAFGDRPFSEAAEIWEAIETVIKVRCIKLSIYVTAEPMDDSDSRFTELQLRECLPSINSGGKGGFENISIRITGGVQAGV